MSVQIWRIYGETIRPEWTLFIFGEEVFEDSQFFWALNFLDLCKKLTQK